MCVCVCVCVYFYRAILPLAQTWLPLLSQTPPGSLLSLAVMLWRVMEVLGTLLV